MCIICIEFTKSRDLLDARRMLAHARKEPQAIGAEHLEELGAALDQDLGTALDEIKKISKDPSETQVTTPLSRV